ncbi:MAG: HEAT repeat domain-containing protein [Planctomycetaceae bacterium]|nr:HEAT repeat domain-containing protein [Planctomycetaceae bacterium]
MNVPKLATIVFLAATSLGCLAKEEPATSDRGAEAAPSRTSPVALNGAADRAGPPGPAEIAEMIKSLADADARTRGEAAEELGALGLLAKDAVPALTKALDDAVARVRGNAAAALGQILEQDIGGETVRDRGPHLDQAVAGLSKSLGDEEPAVRTMAALSLGQIGPAAAAAVPALSKALDDPEASVRNAAQMSLALIRNDFPGVLK